MGHMNSGGKPKVKVFTNNVQKFYMPCYYCALITVGGDFVESNIDVIRKGEDDKVFGDEPEYGSEEEEDGTLLNSERGSKLEHLNNKDATSGTTSQRCPSCLILKDCCSCRTMHLPSALGEEQMVVIQWG